VIVKVMGSHILSCDTCKTSVTRPFQSWDHALDHVKQNGWKMTMGLKGYDFKHICPNCQGGLRNSEEVLR
jgi:hypothetical protein